LTISIALMQTVHDVTKRPMKGCQARAAVRDVRLLGMCVQFLHEQEPSLVDNSLNMATVQSIFGRD
jgi:hypothetical protein